MDKEQDSKMDKTHGGTSLDDACDKLYDDFTLAQRAEGFKAEIVTFP